MNSFVKVVAGLIAGLAIGYWGSGLLTTQPKDRDIKQVVSGNQLAGSAGQGSLAGAGAGEGMVHEVRDGMSIQEAVIAAKPGDVIKVYPGTYSETVYVDKDDITLTGIIIEGEWPTLDGNGTLNDAVLYSGNNFLVENMKIVKYKGNGVMGQAGNNFIIRNNIIDDTGVYGIFPQLGKNGLIINNIVSNIADAAIYVGMSDNIDVIGNEVFDSVAGIEIENSRHSLVEGNYTYNNSGGILAFITPGLPIKTTYDVIIRRNFVLNNNHENFAAPGSTVSHIPPGTGVLIMAADDVVLEDNIISGNETVGIAITSLDEFGNAAADPLSEPNSDRVAILNNVIHSNGDNPQGLVGEILGTLGMDRGPDIIDSGQGVDKCISNGSRYRLVFIKDTYSECDVAARTTLAINTKTLDEPAPPYVVEGDTAENLEHRVGKRGFFAICTGCHAFNARLIGPNIEEIQAIYEDNPEAMADYIAEPIKVRGDDFPPMPPQNYLSAETRLAIAKYMLKAKNSGDSADADFIEGMEERKKELEDAN